MVTVMTLYSWGNPRHFPRLPPPVRRYFDVARATRVVADCHWQAEPWTRTTLIALHGLERLERRALHARARREGVRARHERRTAEPAQLRRHRTSVGRAVPLGADRRRRARGRRADARRRADRHRRRGLLAGRQPRAEAGRRVRRVTRRRARRRRSGVAHHRDQRVHARAGAAGQRAVSVEFRARPEAAHAAEGRSTTRAASI